MDAYTESHVRGVIIALLLDPRNDDEGFVLQAEASFGSHAFDTHFTSIKTDALLSMLREYANDEEPGWNRILDFLDTVNEFVARPCSSNLLRMVEASRRT